MMTTPVQLMTINCSNAAATAANCQQNVADFMTKVPPNSFSRGLYCCGYQRGSASSEKCSSNKTIIINIIDDDGGDGERRSGEAKMIFQNGFA